MSFLQGLRFYKHTTVVVTCNLNSDLCTDEKTRNCEKALSLFRNFSLPIIHTEKPSEITLWDEDLKEFGLRPNELVIGVPDIGAFTNTDLMDQLKALGVNKLLFIGGYMTSNAGTVIEAHGRGFECYIVDDCMDVCKESFHDSGPEKDEFLGIRNVLHSRMTRQLSFADRFISLSKVSEAINASNQASPPKPWDIQCRDALDIPVLLSAYASSSLTPTRLIKALHSRFSGTPDIEKIFLHLESLSSLKTRASSLEAKYPHPHQRPPLYGIPFSVKDSFDVATILTSAACDVLRYTPTDSAYVVEKLLSLGGILIGKTNMDQLATGLTGCRSPYGIPPNACSPDYVPGGSSSGACVSVAAGLVSFAVGTDTAGSGRVPAGFNGIVGFKPTKGTVSLKGVVKACESFDCIAYETLSVGSARTLWRLTRGFDPEDRMAKQQIAPAIQRCSVEEDDCMKFSIAIPPQKNLGVCSDHYQMGFAVAVAKLRSLGATVTKLSDNDWELFEAAGKLLYEGSFVLERLAGLPKGWLDENIRSLHPVTERVFQTARSRLTSAEDLFRDLHSMMSLRRRAQILFKKFDLVLVPTTPMIPTIEEVDESPLRVNELLGTFSHAANVLDLCAIALPVTLGDGPPFSVTLMGAEREDADLLTKAALVENSLKGF